MDHDRSVRILLKITLLAFIPLLLIGGLALADLFQRILKRAVKEKGRETAERILVYKGLLGILDLFERKGSSKKNT